MRSESAQNPKARTAVCCPGPRTMIMRSSIFNAARAPETRGAERACPEIPSTEACAEVPHQARRSGRRRRSNPCDRRRKCDPREKLALSSASYKPSFGTRSQMRCSRTGASAEPAHHALLNALNRSGSCAACLRVARSTMIMAPPFDMKGPSLWTYR
jgi:hypothetical protein